MIGVEYGYFNNSSMIKFQKNLNRKNKELQRHSPVKEKQGYNQGHITVNLN